MLASVAKVIFHIIFSQPSLLANTAIQRDIILTPRSLSSKDKVLKRLEVSQLLGLDEQTIPLLCSGMARVSQVSGIRVSVMARSIRVFCMGQLLVVGNVNTFPSPGEACLVWPPSLPSVELPCSTAWH